MKISCEKLKRFFTPELLSGSEWRQNCRFAYQSAVIQRASARRISVTFVKFSIHNSPVKEILRPWIVVGFWMTVSLSFDIPTQYIYPLKFTSLRGNIHSSRSNLLERIPQLKTVGWVEPNNNMDCHENQRFSRNDTMLVDLPTNPNIYPRNDS